MRQCGTPSLNEAILIEQYINARVKMHVELYVHPRGTVLQPEIGSLLVPQQCTDNVVSPPYWIPFLGLSNGHSHTVCVSVEPFLPVARGHSPTRTACEG